MTFGSQIHFDRLRLIRSPNIGPVSYRQLMSRFGSAKAALEALPDLVRRRGGKQMVLANEAAVAREFQITRAFGGDMSSRVILTIRSCYRTSTMRRR